MTKSTRRSQRLPSAALLLLALAIATGWSQAAAPGGRNGRSDSIATQRDQAIAIPHGPAHAGPTTAALAEHRASEAALVASARTLLRTGVAASRATEAAPVVKTKAKAPAVKAKAPATNAPTSKYSGTNHFWFPALGISRAVVLFPCSRKRAPDDYLYRWGCAGRNNAYLMGHASSVLRRLHDAYLGGRLHAGMLAVYADGNGRVRTYRVATWRVVSPTNSAWAIASQRVPSMTIQTCIGLKRLNVRLVAIN